MDLKNSMLLANMMKKSDTPIPPNYELVDYIGRYSSPYVYIDTGIYPNDTVVFRTKCTMKAYNGGSFIGYYNTEEDNFRFFRHIYTTYMDYGSSQESPIDYRIHVPYWLSNTDPTYEVEVGNLYMKDLTTNIIQVQRTPVTFTEKPYTMRVFDTANYGYIYYLQIEKNGSLVRDYVPVFDTITNKYGLYDKVNLTFSVSPNGNNFIGGND